MYRYLVALAVKATMSAKRVFKKVHVLELLLVFRPRGTYRPSPYKKARRVPSMNPLRPSLAGMLKLIVI